MPEHIERELTESAQEAINLISITTGMSKTDIIDTVQRTVDELNDLKSFIETYNNSKRENDADLELTDEGKLRVFKRVEVGKEKKLPKKLRNGWS